MTFLPCKHSNFRRELDQRCPTCGLPALEITAGYTMLIDEEEQIKRQMDALADMGQPVGMKFDDNKPQVARGVLRYFPEALREVARVSEFGARKYAWDNWNHVDDGIQRYTDAMARHMLDAANHPQSCDEESRLHHLAHAAWCALAVLELVIRGEKSQNIPVPNDILGDPIEAQTFGPIRPVCPHGISIDLPCRTCRIAEYKREGHL